MYAHAAPGQDWQAGRSFSILAATWRRLLLTTWILRKLNATNLAVERHWQKTSRSVIAAVALAFALLILHQLYNELFELVVLTLSDAYLGVSVFVALTLAVFYTLDRYFNAGLTRALNRGGWLQIPTAALLGALPGCGGAIIVVTQFVHGRLSFGALVAVLVATMGDAAFILIAHEPATALVVYGTSLVAGAISGYVVNAIHGARFLAPETSRKITSDVQTLPLPTILTRVFMLLLVPGTLLGLLGAMQIDLNDELLDILPFATGSIGPTEWLGFAGAALCIIAFWSQPLNSWSARFFKHQERTHLHDTVVAETSFVTVWVAIGFLSFELLVHFTALDLKAAFAGLGMLAPLLAILIGFVPGCGPQIIVTTLYLNGVVSLSCQLGNAISNDGDALFPAIALAPKAAMTATIYSAIPAFIVAYIAYGLGW